MNTDSSAIIALIQGETASTEQIAAALAAVFDRLSSEINLDLQPFTVEHVALAHRAYVQYGKGRHPAALNYGDTMAYATAKLAHEPLIAVGNDFAQTDLEFNGVIGYWPNALIRHSRRDLLQH
ncbi:type II toxin-antitoxin system VapC family toxin [Mycobacterium heidelbergense]|uniref:type II toxin-antitoxin system VapC family toxin n=1 Tax=Mycobacterium heidelbergense TaxID=53376 RepID=UPI003CFB5CE6